MIWSQFRNRALLFHTQKWDGRVKGNFKNTNFIFHILLCSNKHLCYLKSTIMIVFELGKNMTTHFSHKCPNTLSTWLISEKVHPDFAFLWTTLSFPVLLTTPLTLSTCGRSLNYFSKHCAFLSICSQCLLVTYESKAKVNKIGQERAQISRFKGLWDS